MALADPPTRLAAWLAPFSVLFTSPTWQRVLVLMNGAILASHRRTVSAALRAVGRDTDGDFARYHAVLNRARWSALAASRVLLGLLIDRFAHDGPIVIGLDDTIERRWGVKIKARGIYRDPVRSSMVISSRRAACAGFRPCCSCRSRGPGGFGPCRFSHVLCPPSDRRRHAAQGIRR